MARNIFDPNGSPVAARDFVFAGVTYKKDAAFPWRKLGRSPDGKPIKLPENELRGLWLADLIDFPDRQPKGAQAD